MKILSTLIPPIIFFLSLTACSSNPANNQLGKLQNVETGTVINVTTVKIIPERINSYGNVGVGIGSGGYRGIFGSVDVGTLARIFRNATGPKIAQEIIVRKTNGEVVAVTQASKTLFKQGDRVKILLRKGQAEVIY